jgi:hypothetical protein
MWREECRFFFFIKVSAFGLNTKRRRRIFINNDDTYQQNNDDNTNSNNDINNDENLYIVEKIIKTQIDNGKGNIS